MKTRFLLFTLLLLTACGKSVKDNDEVFLQNPIIPGYFADPSVVEYEGKFYMYATSDPWGGDFLSCWESDDFQEWTFNKLNWPTKEACTSPLSNENMVWAPSVVKKGDKFYLYISVGSEVWCGVAEHPLGPWKNMLGDKPMIPYDTTRFYHVIDAEAFIDDDGKAYLYWGSGWEWINGHCYAAELNEDMSSFKSEMVEVTPTRYFEGPFVIKHNSKYYLTYSEGKTIEDTYEVRYAVGDTPFGPFTEAENSPILKTNKELQVYGPGHHTIYPFQGKNYMLYHRHKLPFESGTAFRQICINEMQFEDGKDRIKNITPEHTQSFPNLAKNKREHIRPDAISASSEKESYTSAKNALDNNFSTLWKAADEDANPWIMATFKPDTQINTMEIRFEYPWKNYYIKVDISADGNEWETVKDYLCEGVTGSPVVVPVNEKTTYLKISFEHAEEVESALWDVYFY